MWLLETEHRVLRTDAQGNRFEYSDKSDRPFGEGWQRVDPVKHPRAKVYLWFRPYSYVAKEYTEQRRPKPIVTPTTLQIDPSLMPKLGVNFEDTLTALRQEIRTTLAQAKQPYYTGDRVQVPGEKGVFYVKRINDKNGRIVVQDAADKERNLIKTADELQRDFEMLPVPWTIGDVVTVAGSAVGGKDNVDGSIIGFDHFTNRLRVAVGSGTSFEVYPEAVIGVRGKNADILKGASKFLEEHPDSLSAAEDKLVIDALLRAVLDGREQVTTTELYEDIKATSGHDVPPQHIQGKLGAISSIFSGGKDHAVFFNPVADSIFLRDGQLAIRLLANSRGVKNSHKKFGWKNITKENPEETYAHIGQDVLFEEEARDAKERFWQKGRIRRIEGGRAEVAFGGTSRMISLDVLKDLGGRRVLPDPTDPAAFGSLNRNAFWLLRDREWCRDYKRGDVVALLSTTEDAFGTKGRGGSFGKVIDTTSNGQLLLELADGKRHLVSPRQVKQTRQVTDVKQLIDRVNVDPTSVYGTTTIIRQGDAEARIGIGGERKHRFMSIMFPTGGSYLGMESSLFTGIMDDRATQNRTRSIMPMNEEEFPQRTQLTLAPSESLFRILQKMYPSAKRVLITRQAQLIPGTKPTTRPDAEPAAMDYTDAERRAAIKRGEKPPGGGYFNPFDVQRGMRKRSRNDKTYYAPEGGSADDLDQSIADEGLVFDPQSGQLLAPGDTHQDAVRRSPVAKAIGKLSYLNPFRSDSQTVGATLHYTAADVETLRNTTPVTVRILVDPTDKEVRESVGVAHDVATLARHYSAWNDVTKRPATAVMVDAQTWGNRVRLSADETNLYVSLGDDLAKQTSEQFKDAEGRPLSFHQLVTMSLTEKYLAWEKGRDTRALQQLLDLSSLFTYDSAHKRYSTNLANYNEAHKFLQTFFGERTYSLHAYEDIDGAFATPAVERRLAERSQAYKKAYETQSDSDVEKDKLPSDLVGFRTGPLNDPIRDYQREAVNFMLTHNHTLLANDQGTGKTASILAAIKGRMNRKQVKRALIICPASLVSSVWPSEIETWCKDQAQIDKIEGSKNLTDEQKKKRIAALPTTVPYMALTSKSRDEFFSRFASSSEGLAVTSYDMANLYGKELQKMGFDLVALDEAQNIKTGKTKTRQGSQRAETLKDVFTDVPFKIAATGTPIENSADDLHSVVSWLNPSLLGPAESFAQDFIEVDYVQTPEGKKQAVNVAIKKPRELMERLKSVMIRTSKRSLELREQKALKMKIDAKAAAEGRPSDYNKFLHYGTVSPRLVYPLVSVNPEGHLTVKAPEDVPPYDFQHTDGSLIDLKNPTPEFRQKYGQYLEAVKTANTHYAQHYKGAAQSHHGRYGTINLKATAMLTRMQQVLNDPVILGKEPEFRDNPLFNDPTIPNPKFDRLISILDKHHQKKYHHNIDDLKHIPLDANKTLRDPRRRRLALDSRGKTIVFCDSVEAMKSLKTRLENHNKGEYKGRVLYYAGTDSINELMGLKSNGKQTQQYVEKEFKTNPNYDILVANRAAETGLSFPQANLVVNYELLWNPQAMNQRIDRAHRLGSQHRPVTAFNIATAGTVEEKKLRAHAFKQQLFNDIIQTQEEQGDGEAPPEKFATSAEQLQKRKVLLGDDAVGLVEELLDEDPVLRNVQAASQASLQRAREIRAVAANNAKQAALQKRSGVVKKLLTGWW